MRKIHGYSFVLLLMAALFVIVEPSLAQNTVFSKYDYANKKSNISVAATIAKVGTIKHKNSSFSSTVSSTHLCINDSTILTDTVPGGKWASLDTTIAIIDSVSGKVTGVVTGIDTLINSNLTDTSFVVLYIDSILNPSFLVVLDSICVGATTTVTNFIAGGTWALSNTNGVLDSVVFTGAVAGIDTISYTISNICGTFTSSKTILVNALADAGVITGPSSVCQGAVISIYDTTQSGVWTNTGHYTSLDTSSLTGINPGVDTINYTVTNGCGTVTSSKIITVNTLADPGVILAPDSICIGATITASDSVAGGIWGHFNNALNVDSNLITGVNAGTDTVFFTVTNSCGPKAALKTIVVLPLADAGVITGSRRASQW